METSEPLRQRIEQFAAELPEEFGALSPDAQGCLLSVVEDWAVEVGDQVSRAVINQQLAPAAEEHCWRGVPAAWCSEAGAQAARGNATWDDSRGRTRV
jgi:hypothetical protein